MYDHTCACGNAYKSDDPDGYFCDPCIAKRKDIAAAIDATHPHVPESERHPSPLQRYDAATKVRGFISANDLMA